MNRQISFTKLLEQKHSYTQRQSYYQQSDHYAISQQCQNFLDIMEYYQKDNQKNYVLCMNYNKTNSNKPIFMINRIENQQIFQDWINSQQSNKIHNKQQWKPKKKIVPELLKYVEGNKTRTNSSNHYNQQQIKQPADNKIDKIQKISNNQGIRKIYQIYQKKLTNQPFVWRCQQQQNQVSQDQEQQQKIKQSLPTVEIQENSQVQHFGKYFKGQQDHQQFGIESKNNLTQNKQNIIPHQLKQWISQVKDNFPKQIEIMAHKIIKQKVDNDQQQILIDTDRLSKIEATRNQINQYLKLKSQNSDSRKYVQNDQNKKNNKNSSIKRSKDSKKSHENSSGNSNKGVNGAVGYSFASDFQNNLTQYKKQQNRNNYQTICVPNVHSIQSQSISKENSRHQSQYKDNHDYLDIPNQQIMKIQSVHYQYCNFQKKDQKQLNQNKQDEIKIQQKQIKVAESKLTINQTHMNINKFGITALKNNDLINQSQTNNLEKQQSSPSIIVNINQQIKIKQLAQALQPKILYEGYLKYRQPACKDLQKNQQLEIINKRNQLIDYTKLNVKQQKIIEYTNNNIIDIPQKKENLDSNLKIPLQSDLKPFKLDLVFSKINRVKVTEPKTYKDSKKQQGVPIIKITSSSLQKHQQRQINDLCENHNIKNVPTINKQTGGSFKFDLALDS